MTEFRIGCGGWAYFKIPQRPSLEAYTEVFDFVEVNSTFYQLPGPDLARSWRHRVPDGFEFAVKCHQSITHIHQFKPVDSVFNMFNQMVNLCQVLKTRFLVFETPPSVTFTPEKISEVQTFFSSISPRNLNLVWEIRRQPGHSLSPLLQKVLRNYEIIRCVDLSKEEVAPGSDIIYARIFGKGEHNIYQFTDEELKELDEKITPHRPTVVALSFHTQRMYRDAVRYKTFKQSNKFLPVTKSVGLLSLKEVLLEDAKFPASKSELVNDQGWKVIDLTSTKRVHASALLERLPKDEYANVEAVLQDLSEALGM